MSDSIRTSPSGGAKDLLRLRGDIQIEIRRAGEERPLRRYAIRNTIVLGGLNSPLYLWSQDTGSPTDWRIVRLIPGTVGTPPTTGDISLLGALPLADYINLTPADRTVLPASGELVIRGVLSTGQAVGQTLREIGLFLGNGQLFARQVHPAIQKTGSISVTYTWRIAVTS